MTNPAATLPAPVVIPQRVVIAVLAVLLALTVLTLTGVFDGVGAHQFGTHHHGHVTDVGGRLIALGAR